MAKSYNTKSVQTIVIGGGQAGLAVGYHLARRHLPFLILDANKQIGDAWRNRWDSLRLFNPARYAGLPGMRFPARGDSFPTKDQVADYLGDYVQKFQLPVKNDVKVERLWKEGDRFQIAAGSQLFESENVILAMSNYQQPKIPGFAHELDSEIRQLHSHDYRNPSQLKEGAVLIVGVGNSGADIGIEVVRTHPTWISGKESGHIPWAIDSFFARFFLVRLVRFIGHHVMTVKTRIGRKLRPKLLHQAPPLVRVKPGDLTKAGIERLPRTIGVRSGLPLLEDGRTVEVKNVIWCTGYHHGFPWVDLPIFDEGGDAVHESGIVNTVPGLYFVGLNFLYSMTSATLMGIGRDAERVVNTMSVRMGNAGSPSGIRTVAELPSSKRVDLSNRAKVA